MENVIEVEPSLLKEIDGTRVPTLHVCDMPKNTEFEPLCGPIARDMKPLSVA